MRATVQNSICKRDTSLRALLEAINERPAGIAFIVDDANKLCGVMTDGDLRRLLLDGRDLGDSLRDVRLGDYVFAKLGEDIEHILSKLSSKVRIVPLVNDRGEVVDYFRYDQRLHVPVAMPDLGGNELRYVTDAVLSTWISSTGKYIDRFEQDFAAFCECLHGVTTSNGTVALHLALAALGVGPGDEVIVPDFTFAATANAVLHAGATPVIVDVEAESWCIDPAAVRDALSERTKAIIPVHIYGQPCDMDAIMDIAARNNLYVIEDAAEAHGARYKGRRVGTIGDIGCFSFYGNKVVTTGEGGMCVTNSDEHNASMRLLRDHGMSKDKRYWHEKIGFNYRMTNLQAALGCAQMERIDEILAFRQTVENRYRELLEPLGIVHLQRGDLPGRDKIVWLVSGTVVDGRRDELMRAMKDKGIDVRQTFYSLSDMDVYKQYAFSNKTSKMIAASGLSFPTHKDVDFDKLSAVLANL